MKIRPFNAAQYALLLSPPVLLLTTFFLFRHLSTGVGREGAYLCGFIFYWFAWCFLLPLLTVGPVGFKAMFSSPDPRFGRPQWLGILLLVGPPLLLYATSFRSSMVSATGQFVIYSLMYAVANGISEEILWRGTYVVAFRAHLVWGYLYPSIWFGLWHIAPQVVEAGTVTRGTLSFALVSIGLGLAWGWVARTSGSIRSTALTHVLLNFASPAGAWFISLGD